jgi:Domain of unknown function (DUF4279)
LTNIGSLLESVVLITEQSRTGGAEIDPVAKPKGFASFREELMTGLGMSYEAATAYMDRYNDMVDEVNAVADRYANGAASSLADAASDLTETATSLGDAQPFEYAPDAVSEDAEKLAASTNNPNYAAKMLGYDRKTFNKMLHIFKPKNGLGPATTSSGPTTGLSNSMEIFWTTTFMNMPPDRTSKVCDHALAHATFIISGDAVEPDFWTKYFGVQPDSTITKGKPFLYPSGKLSSRPGKLGLWSVQSEGAVRSDQLAPHLRYLIQMLKLPRGGLRDLVCRDGVKMSLWCYWDNETGDRIPDVPDDIRAMMESLGGVIEIDEYR